MTGGRREGTWRDGGLGPAERHILAAMGHAGREVPTQELAALRRALSAAEDAPALAESMRTGAERVLRHLPRRHRLGRGTAAAIGVLAAAALAVGVLGMVVMAAPARISAAGARALGLLVGLLVRVAGAGPALAWAAAGCAVTGLCLILPLIVRELGWPPPGPQARSEP